MEARAGARGARSGRLPEDLGLAGHPRQRAHRAALGLLPRCGGRRSRWPARWSAALPDAGHLEVVEGGAGRARVHRLQPERARPHGRVGLLRAQQPRGARLVPADVGRGARRRAGRPHAGDGARARTERGDVGAAIDDTTYSLESLLDLAARRGRRARRRALAAPLRQAARRAQPRAAESGPAGPGGHRQRGGA